MRSSKGFLYAGLASAILFAVSAPAKAASTLVLTDSGSGIATVTGVTTPAGVTIVATSGTITDVVDNTGDHTVALTLGIAMSVQGSGGTITGGTGTKQISDGSNTDTLELRFIGGSYNATGNITVNAQIVGVTGSNGTTVVGGFDFGNLHNFFGSGTSVLTINDAGENWNNVFGVDGATVTGVAFGIVETAVTVPEPSTMALLGIGMTGFLAFRRLFKRHATA
jgi:hypothetical protein